MKLGLGLYRQSLTDDNLKFARQLGVTHIVVHLVDYFGGSNPELSSGDEQGWGKSINTPLWSADELNQIKSHIESHGLVWEAIENFDPSHWHDVLLDGPRKQEQLENLNQMITTVGELGIPVIGYNFSLAGVWGWVRRPTGRGESMSLVFDADARDLSEPIPNGMVWNMIYDDNPEPGVLGPVSDEQLWGRFEDFLKACLPAAEAAGVKLAAHPDDPPMPALRQTARLVNQPWKYQKMLDLVPSPSNTLECCLGSLQECSEGDVLSSLDSYAKQDAIGYVHFRNVVGKVPQYREVFIDEGDLDMVEALRVLRKNDFDGVLIPDHTPEVSCAAPWHAGMAYALGYMKALLKEVV